MLIFCDSVILIYFCDHQGPLQAKAATRLGSLWTAGDEIAVSDLVRLECRVNPMKAKDAARLAVFDTLFTKTGVVKIPMTTTVFDRATVIRADHGFKTMDSINLATAVEGGCHGFLTHDLALKNFPDIPVEILS
jgi:predicted nucleic acid-binding protein